MAWSKGAVVIVKRGDQEWANAMEQTIAVRKASEMEVDELRRAYEIMKAGRERDIRNKMARLDDSQRRVRKPLRWTKPFREAAALIAYGLSLLSEKIRRLVKR